MGTYYAPGNQTKIREENLTNKLHAAATDLATMTARATFTSKEEDIIECLVTDIMAINAKLQHLWGREDIPF